MTILIPFHQSHYRTFKQYYQQYVLRHLRAEFPNLVSYARFVELTPRVLVPLLFYFLTCRGTCTGIAEKAMEERHRGNSPNQRRCIG